MKNYRNILLDADNTIFDFNRAEKEAIKLTFAEFGIKCDDKLSDLYHKVNDKYWKKLEKKEVTKTELATMRFKEIFDSYHFDIEPLIFNTRYKSNLGKQSFLLPNALELVKYLHSLNKMLIIASNGSSTVQHNRINNSKIKEYINAVYTSEEAGYTKPSKEFFDKLFMKFGINKEDTILIGDSLTADIKGGYEYNIDTIFFSPDNVSNNMPTYTVTSLLNIKNIIK